MSLKARVIPCLDVKDGRVVKGVNFVDLIDAGDPVEAAKAYDAAGADELCFLDITASSDNRDTIFDVVARTADHCFMPVTVGGGVRAVGDIRKLLSAPRINRGRADAPARDAGTPQATEPSGRELEAQRLWMHMARKLVESTEDVGRRFAEEARRIHYNETPARAIRGEATPREAADLAEEGIEVFAFPMPAALKNPVQ